MSGADAGPLAGQVRTVRTEREARLPDDVEPALLERPVACPDCRERHPPEEVYILPATEFDGELEDGGTTRRCQGCRA
jgi:hypothetical protein